MAELKTRQTRASVAAFLDGIADSRRRRDCRSMLALMKKVTRATPRMWGPSIVGFGSHRLRSAGGRELDWFTMGFSPRKQALTLYITLGVEHHAKLLAKLGDHTTGKSCLYIRNLERVDVAVLDQLLTEAVARQAKQEA